jgi:hypothetical protein
MISSHLFCIGFVRHLSRFTGSTMTEYSPLRGWSMPTGRRTHSSYRERSAKTAIQLPKEKRIRPFRVSIPPPRIQTARGTTRWLAPPQNAATPRTLLAPPLPAPECPAMRMTRPCELCSAHGREAAAVCYSIQEILTDKRAPPRHNDRKKPSYCSASLSPSQRRASANARRRCSASNSGSSHSRSITATQGATS